MSSNSPTVAPLPTLRSDVVVTTFVSIAHALSHFFQLVMPPLFLMMKDELGVSFAALGALSAITYTVSGFMQTPAGFAVDRFGGHRVLVFGLAMIALAALIAGAAPGYPMLIVAAAVAGVGNSVFHPADLALINNKVTPQRLGYAFSVHSVCGNLGWVVAPLFSVAIAAHYNGWRSALTAAGLAGLVYAVLFAMQGSLATSRSAPGAVERPRVAVPIGLLLSAPVLLCFGFFLLMSMSMVAYMTFAATAFNQLYALPLVSATGILTSFFVGGAVGTLCGGWIASRSVRHDHTAAIGMALAAIGTLLVATAWLPIAMLTLVVAFVGFAIGAVSPSRDILVRAIAPTESRGKVYGFVYSGLDAGSAVGPLVFGFLLDHQRSALVFVVAAAMLFASLLTIYRMRGGGVE